MCSCFFLHLGTQKWQANQPCGILATSKGTLCHNLLNFRVKAWVKLWVRLRITQVVVMVMVWEHLQETNPSVCNVLTSDENKVCACATCLPSEFLYPVLYNISRPHWFWNKHLPSRELGPPAKFVWSVYSRFLCLPRKHLFAMWSFFMIFFFLLLSDGACRARSTLIIWYTYRSRSACDTSKWLAERRALGWSAPKPPFWCFQSAAMPPRMLATSQQEMTGGMRHGIPHFYHTSKFIDKMHTVLLWSRFVFH